ncbi:DUF4232 domain-containing protein [Streptomyces minutiscleroticus]|uniref:DUF4232 domain-containing protein n=1 Tax=Streptomyces minutiscleroticus TaxID=68238 RepID=UPI0033337B21
MTPIRGTAVRSALGAVTAAVLALAVSGCGISAELDRERNPERRPTPTPTPTPGRTYDAPAPAVPPASATPSPSVPGLQADDCPASGVRMTTGRVDGAMGLRSMILILMNCGTRPYRLEGHPAVGVLDGTGRLFPDVRSAEGTDGVPMAPADPGPAPLTLAPGGSAWAGLYWRMGNKRGEYLRVTPEKGRDAVTFRPLEYLDVDEHGTLGTTAWQPAER